MGARDPVPRRRGAGAGTPPGTPGQSRRAGRRGAGAGIPRRPPDTPGSVGVARPRPPARRRRAIWALGAALLGLLALAVLAGRGAGRGDPAARDQPPRDPISRVIREIGATRTAALSGLAVPTPAPSPLATPPATPTTAVATP